MWGPYKRYMKQAWNWGWRSAFWWLWTTTNCLWIWTGAGGQTPPCWSYHRAAAGMRRPWFGWAPSMGQGSGRLEVLSLLHMHLPGAQMSPCNLKVGVQHWIIYKDSLPQCFGLVNWKLHSFLCSFWTSLLIIREKSCPSHACGRCVLLFLNFILGLATLHLHTEHIMLV